MALLTPDELDAIRKRADAATVGPWEWGTYFKGDWIGGGCCLHNGYDQNGHATQQIGDDGSACGEYGATIDISGPDAQFIAHSRTDIPALLAHIAELQWRLDDLNR